jgi:hypothetical protein
VPRFPLSAPGRPALARMRLVDVIQDFPEALHGVASSDVPRGEWGAKRVGDVEDPDALLDAIGRVIDWRGAEN